MSGKTRKTHYPDTIGSKLAAKTRKLANSLSDEERSRLLNKGLSLIYGSGSKKAVGSRH